MKHKSASEQALEILQERSRKGLELAKRTILSEKTMCKQASEALEYYASYWENYTHTGLFSLACEAVGGDLDEAVDVQAAIAMFAGTLDIHDDIIDNSKVKRGKNTVLGEYGLDTTLILGDIFLVSSFALLNKATAEMPKNKRLEVFATVRRALLELGNAHILESTLKRKLDVDPEYYLQILRMKAASIEADTRVGALVGNGTDREVEALTKYGRLLGTLVTLREEFIDIFDAKELAHRAHKECLPVPILYAMKNSEDCMHIQSLIAKKRITQASANDFVDIIFKSQNVKKLRKLMTNMVKQGVSMAQAAHCVKPRNILIQLAKATLEDL
jgi:geranylgeranyl pyrophosphate synthase